MLTPDRNRPRCSPCSLLFGLTLALASCAGPAPEAGVIPVASGQPERPRLRYLDGQLSPNSSCAIRLGNKLNPRIPPVRVNGQPIGFC